MGNYAIPDRIDDLIIIRVVILPASRLQVSALPKSIGSAGVMRNELALNGDLEPVNSVSLLLMPA